MYYCTKKEFLRWNSHIVNMVRFYFVGYVQTVGRSQWSLGLRSSSAAARHLRLWVQIPPGGWMFFCCECCVMSGRGL